MTKHSTCRDTYGERMAEQEIVIAMRFPMLKPGVEHTRTKQQSSGGRSELLERDLGAALFIRCNRLTVWKATTTFGQSLLDKVTIESAHARIIAALDGTHCPQTPVPPAFSAVRLFERLVVQRQRHRGRTTGQLQKTEAPGSPAPHIDPQMSPDPALGGGGGVG